MFGFLNLYEFEIVRENGERSSEHGVTLRVYDRDMVSAREQVMKERRKQGWTKTTPAIVDVQLNVTAWAHVRGHVSKADEAPSIWYRNHRSMIGDAMLRL